MEPPPRLDDAVRLLLGELGEDAGGATPLRFAEVRPEAWGGRAAAVDGGQSVVADLGSCGVVAVRAGYTLRDAEDGYEDRLVRDVVHVVVRRRAPDLWRELIAPYDWGADLEPPLLSGQQWIRAWCEAERTVAEYDAARRALRLLRSGDLLLLDGSLEPDLPQGEITGELVAAARREGVAVAGVTKDTSLTLGGVLPFTLELETLAPAARAPPRFACDVTDALGRAGPFRTFGLRLDARSPVYRVDVAPPDGAAADGVLPHLAALANDVAYPGYPYPLARVHRAVHYTDDDGAELKRRLEALVSERRGSLFGSRILGRGRDVLALGG